MQNSVIILLDRAMIAVACLRSFFNKYLNQQDDGLLQSSILKFREIKEFLAQSGISP